MPKHCYVYLLRSLKDHQFYVGSRGICLCECNSIIRDSLPQLRSACHLNSCTGKAVSTKVTQRTARNISRARGASDISNGDCSSISRGEEPFGLESWFC